MEFFGIGEEQIKELMYKEYVPVSCTFLHAKEEGDMLKSISFVTDWGVVNEYSINEEGSPRIETIIFPDGYRINVDELLGE